MKIHPFTAALLLAALQMGGQRLKADPINVNDPSFETPNIGPGDSVGSISPSWFATSSTGVVNDPSSFAIATGVSGKQVAFINGTSGSGGFGQNLNTLLNPNTTYTVNIDIAQRSDVSSAAGSSLLLLLNDPNNGNAFYAASAVYESQVNATAFQTFSVSFTTGGTLPANGANPDGLQFVAFDNGIGAGGGTQFIFDNVTATAISGVPEPSTWIGGALLAGLAMARFVPGVKRAFN